MLIGIEEDMFIGINAETKYTPINDDDYTFSVEVALTTDQILCTTQSY